MWNLSKKHLKKFLLCEGMGKNEGSWGDMGWERRPRTASIAWRHWIVLVAAAALLARQHSSTAPRFKSHYSALLSIIQSPHFTFIIIYWIHTVCSSQKYTDKFSCGVLLCFRLGSFHCSHVFYVFIVSDNELWQWTHKTHENDEMSLIWRKKN